jgi:dephospho-CoA kinase
VAVLRVGLTGGIGSGKSTASGRLAELGAMVIDSDVLAREVVEPGTPGLAAIRAAFGPDVIAADGTLDRPRLGQVVFADPERLAVLNGIVHPLVRARAAAISAAAGPDAVVVQDVPLLVETGQAGAYDLVLVVEADEATRVARLVERGLSADDARARIASQATDEQRRAAADVWLPNDGHKDDLLAAVDTLWHERLVPFEENVRHGRRSHRPESFELVPSDPAWAAQAQRLLERLRLAFGDVLVTADHIGSTAVPGLLAKDVIDLQVGVRSLDDADGETVRARLDAAGFPRADGVYADFDRGSEGTWPKRMHGNADPARVAHIHVREAGSPGWLWALMFRDWMREDPSALAEYAAEKARLAEAGLTASEYAEAKEPWFDAAHPRAQAWADDTGWAP